MNVRPTRCTKPGQSKLFHSGNFLCGTRYFGANGEGISYNFLRSILQWTILLGGSVARRFLSPNKNRTPTRICKGERTFPAGLFRFAMGDTRGEEGGRFSFRQLQAGDTDGDKIGTVVRNGRSRIRACHTFVFRISRFQRDRPSSTPNRTMRVRKVEDAEGSYLQTGNTEAASFGEGAGRRHLPLAHSRITIRGSRTEKSRCLPREHKYER